MGRIEQYLQRYAEPDSNLTLNGSWTHSLVIPACDEGEDFVARLKTLDATTECDALLVIVVINGREDADPAIHHQNQRCADAIGQHFKPTNGPRVFLWRAGDTRRDGEAGVLGGRLLWRVSRPPDEAPGGRARRVAFSPSDETNHLDCWSQSGTPPRPTGPRALKRRISDGMAPAEDLASTVRSPSLNDQNAEVQKLMKTNFDLRLPTNT